MNLHRQLAQTYIRILPLNNPALHSRQQSYSTAHLNKAPFESCSSNVAAVQPELHILTANMVSIPGILGQGRSKSLTPHCGATCAAVSPSRHDTPRARKGRKASIVRFGLVSSFLDGKSGDWARTGSYLAWSRMRALGPAQLWDLPDENGQAIQLGMAQASMTTHFRASSKYKMRRQ